MASPRHYGHTARDIANVMQKLQGRLKVLTHSHCSTSFCRVFRGDLVLGMTQQKQHEKKRRTVAARTNHKHDFLFALDLVGLICGWLVWRINVWYGKDETG